MLKQSFKPRAKEASSAVLRHSQGIQSHAYRLEALHKYGSAPPGKTSKSTFSILEDLWPLIPKPSDGNAQDSFTKLREPYGGLAAGYLFISTVWGGPLNSGLDVRLAKPWGCRNEQGSGPREDYDPVNFGATDKP